MTTIPNDSLHVYGDRVKGKVVLITGGAAGFGKASALQFAKYGAKVVIGDLNVKGSQDVVNEILKAGGVAICQRMNLVEWDDQVALFELAIKQFGCVDIVIANAGVTEMGLFANVKLRDGLPVKPQFKTLEVNLKATMCTVHLALHYLHKDQVIGSLKSLVVLGSMASWQAIARAKMYTTSKFGVLGLVRSIHPHCERMGIRIAIVNPWFADTQIVPRIMKVFLAGFPLCDVKQVASTIFNAATDPNPKTSGSAYLLLDEGPTFRIEPEIMKEGIYAIIDARSKLEEKAMSNMRTILAFWHLFNKPILTFLPIVGACLYYFRR